MLSITKEPLYEEICSQSGPVLLEFGTEWCLFCQATQGMILSELSSRSDIKHIKVEDGKGRLLGRAFLVKYWPTLIFMRDGFELRRLVRPTNVQEIRDALNLLV